MQVFKYAGTFFLQCLSQTVLSMHLPSCRSVRCVFLLLPCPALRLMYLTNVCRSAHFQDPAPVCGSSRVRAVSYSSRCILCIMVFSVPSPVVSFGTLCLAPVSLSRTATDVSNTRRSAHVHGNVAHWPTLSVRCITSVLGALHNVSIHIPNRRP